MRAIKFRGMGINGEWYYGLLSNPKIDMPGGAKKGHWYISNSAGSPFAYEVRPETIGQFSGEIDKVGSNIYEGDEIEYMVPYRTTQTHTGDNIPNGSYTEPMEPGIKIRGGTVVFKDGMFQIEGEYDDGYTDPYPLAWAFTEWDLKGIEEAISYNRPGASPFDDPEEGDLQYLISEVAKVKDADELISLLSSVLIKGNIHENPELIQCQQSTPA